jgi:hypothetical protein
VARSTTVDHDDPRSILHFSAPPSRSIFLDHQPVSVLMTVTPHTPGMREHLCREIGGIHLTARGESWPLKPGAVLVFRGDQKHSHTNPGGETAVAYSVVAFHG